MTTPPTTDRRIPPPGQVDMDLESLMRASAEHGAPMVGPSLDEDEAREFVREHRAEPMPGPINHVALQVTDLPASERWYTETLGLIRVDGEIAADGTGHVALLSPSGGWIVTLASAPAPGVDHLAIACEDRDALVRSRESLAARGAAPGTITDAPYGSGFVLRDPDGNDVELFAPAPQ